MNIKAEENLQTREIRNAMLLDVWPGKAAFDEEEFSRAVELGTKAWADVPDIGAWVAEQRGAVYEADSKKKMTFRVETQAACGCIYTTPSLMA